MRFPPALALSLVPLGPCAAQEVDAPDPLEPLPSERQLAWHQRERYAFVHFNMNTFTGLEWGTGTEDPDLFQPSELDCAQWVEVVQAAGFTGIILTAKHHDGFCLWPSDFSEHDVAASSWRDGQGDVLAELSAACHAAGIGFGVYLSPWDRSHPSYGDSPVYNAVFAGQLHEVLGRYGEVFEVWFDGACGEGPNGKRQVYDWDLFHDIVRELQPNAVIFHGGRPDVRWVGNERGYVDETNWNLFRRAEYAVGEGERPAELVTGHADGTDWIPAECDVSIRPGWYYHPEQDGAVKSLALLEDIYYGSVGRGANLLLNLPVDRRGLVPEKDAARLLELGALVTETFDDDLCRGSLARASNERGDDDRFGAGAALDGDPSTYWATDDDVRHAFLDVDLLEPRTVNRILLAEPIALGQRISAFHVEARIDGRWTEVGRGTTVGARRMLHIDPVRATHLRFVIEDARAAPLLSRVAAFCAPPSVEIEVAEPVFLGSTRVTLTTDLEEAEIRYTLDGTRPGPESTRYAGPFELDRSAELVALAYAPGNPGLVPARCTLRAYTPATLREPLHTFVAPSPGWRLRAYEGAWTGLEAVRAAEAAAGSGAESARESVVERVSLDPRPRAEGFALVFEGVVRAPEDGIYTFYLASDDGSRLYAGEELVVDNDGLHGRVERAGAVGLKAGWQPLRVEYFDAGGDASLELAWRGPKLEKQEIAPDRVGHL